MADVHRIRVQFLADFDDGPVQFKAGDIFALAEDYARSLPPERVKLLGTPIGTEPAWGGSVSASGLATTLEAAATTDPASLARIQASVSGGSAAKLIVFSTAVPLTGNGVMPQTLVSSPLAFSVSGTPILFGSAYVRLIADGTNTPTFSGMSEHGSSSGYVNTSGIVNNVQVWHDGTSAWYAVSQAANATPVAIPTLVSAVASVDTPTVLTLTYSTALNTTPPAASAYTLTNTGGADAVTGVAISGNAVVLTKSRSTLGGDAITLTYTPPATNPVSAQSSGIAAAALSSQTVSVVGGIIYPQLATRVNIAESAAGGGGYLYTSTGGDFTSAYAAGATKSLASGASGWIEFVRTTLNGFVIVGLDPDPAAAGYTAFDIGVSTSSSASNYSRILGGGLGGVNGVVTTPQVGDVLRFTVDRSTNSCELRLWRTAEYGVSAGVVLHSFTGVSSAHLYPCITLGTSQSVGPIRANGVT